MLRGVATVIYVADDVEVAAAWYEKILGTAPYFRRDADGVAAYMEFRIGDLPTELALMDRRFATRSGTGEGVSYWHVDDLDDALERLVDAGATVAEPRQERGEGFVTAVVTDPFGNALGVMENPHYLERQAEIRQARVG